MKKVLFTATVDSHILQFHIPFLKLFKENGYEVHVATNGCEEIPYCDVRYTVCFDRSPFKLNNLKAIKSLKKIINKEKFDIIHTHTPMGSAVTRLAAKKARKKYNTRVIYTAHGFHFYKGAPKKNWIIFYPVEKFLAKYTDTLITINKEDYFLAKRKFKNRCKDINYIPGVGIDPKKFDIKMTEKEKISFRKSLGLNKDDFVLIFPAELSKRKGQIWLIKSLSNLLKSNKKIHLLLPGSDSLNGECQKITKELNLLNQIHFLGYRKDIPKLLTISNVAVSSSNQEGLPVNIMEAIYVGLPIVVSNCRGNRDLITNGVNGYLYSINDSETFIDILNKIISNKRENDNKKNIEYDFLIDNIINKYKKVYFRKKRVLHVLASNKFSGAENVACTIISNMSDKYDMAYCSPKGPIKKSLEERKVKYFGIDKLNIRNLKKIIKIYNPDIIHAHDYRALFFTSFFYKQIKIISHIHVNNPLVNQRTVYSYIFSKIFKKVSKIIWVSDSALDNYYYKNKVIDKSIVLYNVIDSKYIQKKSKEDKLNKIYDLIFLGRLSEQKNPKRLIEIVSLIKRKNKNIKVAIVGDGDKRDILTKLIKDNKLENNIELLGSQNNPYPILYNSKILIMTSRWEGTPMVALEAQCLEKPIVATPVDGLKKIVKNDYNGYLSDNDEILSNKIIEYLNNIKIYKLLSNNSGEFSENYNNIEKYIEKFKKIYNGE